MKIDLLKKTFSDFKGKMSNSNSGLQVEAQKKHRNKKRRLKCLGRIEATNVRRMMKLIGTHGEVNPGVQSGVSPVRLISRCA